MSRGDLPVFPQQAIRDGEGLLQSVAAYGFEPGMTVRQVYAAFALQGMLANSQQDYSPLIAGKHQAIAQDAWHMADAMLAAESATGR